MVLSLAILPPLLNRGVRGGDERNTQESLNTHTPLNSRVCLGQDVSKLILVEYLVKGEESVLDSVILLVLNVDIVFIEEGCSSSPCH